MSDQETIARVSALSVTAVKATQLRLVESVLLEPGGARGDRAFFLIDDRDRMVNGKHFARLQSIVADWSQDDRRLSFSFPDREPVSAIVDSAANITASFFSGTAVGEVLRGPWSEALSSYLGGPVRVVRVLPSADRSSAVDRGYDGAVSLISTASVRRLAAEGQLDQVDARRFRMLIEVDGIEAHAEDGWIGLTVQIGAAEVRFTGNVGRCLVTTRDPETGIGDVPTLELLGSYRTDIETTEPLPFGIYGNVLRGGAVRLGDDVAVLPG